MRVIETIREIRGYSIEQRTLGRTVGLVPTMGYLHEGHLSLVDKARMHSDKVVLSIFVNPTQFAPNEDLDKYPRDFKRDRELCEARGVDVVFAPSTEEMYPEPISTWVEETSLTNRLCGSSRPTHFRGVATVVAKLFNAVMPDVAVFGEKDYQQAMVVRKMSADLNFHTRIVTAPLVREPDGLAMSSRNKYLSANERKRALSIHQALLDAKSAVASGETDPAELVNLARSLISRNGGEIDYVEVVDPDTLEGLKKIEKKALMLIAAFFGETRLIDNMRLDLS